jgi:peptidoglycan hydrolase-like protein with peptidoglycan-binding domain
MRHVKNIHVIFLMLWSLVPASVGAQSVADLQAQIEALLRQLSSLETRLADAETRVTPPPQAQTEAPIITERHRFCRAYVRELRRGMSGDDVRALQEFLINEGMFSSEPTGYFGPITTEALRAWQAREGIVSLGNEATTGWGVFGPRTRLHFMQWCGGASSTATFSLRVSTNRGIAPLEVTFSTMVSGFRAGIERFVLDYGDGVVEFVAPCLAPADACIEPGKNAHIYAKGGRYTVRLVRTTSLCPLDPACLVHPSSVTLAQAHIIVSDTSACTKEYRPVCGAIPPACSKASCVPREGSYDNRCMMEAAGASYLYAGECRTPKANPADDQYCRSWFDGCNTCGRHRVGEQGFCTEMACVMGFIPGEEPKPFCKSYFEPPATTTATSTR